MTFSRTLARLTLVSALLPVLMGARPLTLPASWPVADFVVGGLWLLGAGLLGLVLASRGRGGSYQLGVAVAVAASLLLVWGNLAVGFIGSEDNPANLLYAGVLAVGFFGAVGARLQPRGMSRALFATALAQFAVPFIALLIWRPELNLGVVWVVVLNTIFAGLWVASALLFRRAAAVGSGPGPQLA